ncbi:hypothetical protein [Duganella sp. CF517]|uniref:hypothetical protein n=1 Tax=Duganella sp. CF517 TaxID=1881038 RepID=UPI001160924B|nr:hypothetical protein [Duganella sp. CF517]
MNTKLLLLSIVAYMGCASAVKSSDRVGNKELPAGAVLMCDEHVVGEASGKPVHIDWQAFGLNERKAKLCSSINLSLVSRPLPALTPKATSGPLRANTMSCNIQ